MSCLLMGPPPTRMLGAHRDTEQPADTGHPEAHRAGADPEKAAKLSGEDGRAEAMLVSQWGWDPGRGRHGLTRWGLRAASCHPIPALGSLLPHPAGRPSDA